MVLNVSQKLVHAFSASRIHQCGMPTSVNEIHRAIQRGRESVSTDLENLAGDRHDFKPSSSREKARMPRFREERKSTSASDQ